MKIQNLAILIIMLFAAAYPGIENENQLHNTTTLPDSSSPSGPPTNCVKGVTCDGRGNCWFATWSGVSVRDKFGNWTEFTPSSGKLADPYNHDVAVDSSGYAWITHHINGVSLLNYNGTLANKADDIWQHFTTTDGLGGNFMVADVTIGPGGYKYFGYSGGLSRLMDNYTPFNKIDDNWTTYPGGVGGLFNGSVLSLLFDQQNCLWAGGDNGLSRKCGDVWTSYNWPGGPDCPAGWSNYVFDLTLDQWGHVWVADGWCGVSEYDGLVWRVYDTINSPLPDHRVRSVTVDTHNNKWFGTEGGVARLDNYDYWTVYHTGEDAWLHSASTEGIAFDQADHGWFVNCASLPFGVSEHIPEQHSVGVYLPNQGEEVLSPDRQVDIELPAYSLPQVTIITYTADTQPPAYLPETSLPAGDKIGVSFFELNAVISGTTTSVTSTSLPYTLTVFLTDADQDSAIEDTLGLYYWDAGEGEWSHQGITSTVNITTNMVTSRLSHLSHFAVLGETNRVYLPLVRK